LRAARDRDKTSRDRRSRVYWLAMSARTQLLVASIAAGNLESASFRPRFVDGELADAARVVLRYHLRPPAVA
jgi:hypothetical protein